MFEGGTSTPRKAVVLVVDDDDDLRSLVSTLLRSSPEGITALGAPNAEVALELVAEQPVDLVLTDLMMPGTDGMSLLKRIRTTWPDIPVVMMTAHGTVETAVEAMKTGAADFILKPLDQEELLFTVAKGLSSSRHFDRRVATPLAPGELIGSAPTMKACYRLIRKAARSRATVLLSGESGTGKELAARAIHTESTRSGGPFVAVHCAALPESLLESELFGYERGAFTGAAHQKPGRVELASGGTLFLDEIGEISPKLQVKLLRLLQERTYERLGGTETRDADVRFVAATNRDLDEMVAAGTFREDLFYRLNVIPITMPPLSERRSDIPVLVERFFKSLATSHGIDSLVIEEGVVERLEAAEWPGNVRQLLNVVERLVVLCDGGRVRLKDVDNQLPKTRVTDEPDSTSGGLRSKRQRIEREAIAEALAKANDNRTLAARLLGVSRRTLYNKLEAYGMLHR